MDEEKTNETNNETDWGPLIILGAIAGYLALWYSVNIAPSQHEVSYVISHLTALFDGRHSFEAYLYLILVLAGVVLQLRAGFKMGDGVKKTDPFWWPAWLAGGAAVCAFIVSLIHFATTKGPECWQSIRDSEWWIIVIACIILLVFLVVVCLVIAAAAAIAVGAYASTVVHFSSISMFLGMLITTAKWFETGKFRPLEMFMNFLDWVSAVPDCSKIWIALLSLLASAGSAFYKTFEHVKFIRGG